MEKTQVYLPKEELDAFCDEKLENDSPGFGKVKTALTDVRQVVHLLLEKKREKEPGLELSHLTECRR